MVEKSQFLFSIKLKKKEKYDWGERKAQFKKINRNHNFSLKSYAHWNGTVYIGVSK